MKEQVYILEDGSYIRKSGKLQKIEKPEASRPEETKEEPTKEEKKKKEKKKK